MLLPCTIPNAANSSSVGNWQQSNFIQFYERQKFDGLTSSHPTDRPQFIIIVIRNNSVRRVGVFEYEHISACRALCLRSVSNIRCYYYEIILFFFNVYSLSKWRSVNRKNKQKQQPQQSDIGEKINPTNSAQNFQKRDEVESRRRRKKTNTNIWWVNRLCSVCPSEAAAIATTIEKNTI